MYLKNLYYFLASKMCFVVVKIKLFSEAFQVDRVCLQCRFSIRDIEASCHTLSLELAIDDLVEIYEQKKK